jgi:hypothetical protein
MMLLTTCCAEGEAAWDSGMFAWTVVACEGDRENTGHAEQEHSGAHVNKTVQLPYSSSAIIERLETTTK